MSNGSNGSGRRPPPPVGGNASRAQPFTPAPRTGGDRQRLKTIGERNPDETGMLQMVPISDDASSEAAADPSATAFFAIPAPKSNRARPTAQPSAPPMPGGPMGGAGAPPIAAAGMGAPPPPPRTPPPPRPSYGGGIGAGGAAAAGGIAQGPIAGYGNAGGAGGGQTPFQVQGGPAGATTSNPAESRSRSYQIYAILFALFVMVCVTGVSVVWLVVISGNSGDSPDVVATNDPPAEPAPAPVAEAEDTGLNEPDPTPTPRPRTNPRPRTDPVPAAPKPPSTPAGEVRVSLNSEIPFTAVEVICPSGVRQRGYFSNGSARISGIPAESCSLNFKGGAPAKFSPVSGGASLKCTYNGSTMLCN